ncbi:MAG TPA: hypothetical protein VM933_10225 [Acidimicrobiales bacterium]|nr:hypothetical protein [Acidimicrobiales bacterium]
MRRIFAVALATAVATGACRVDVRVGLDSAPDGTGTVRAEANLDADAVTELVGQAAGDPDEVDPATRLRVDDLRAAGWAVEGPTQTARGGLEVVATHDYGDEAEAERLLAEVGGDRGPFRDVALTQRRGFFRTSTAFRGTIDLTAGLGTFTDAELREGLEATDEAPLGITPQQLEARLGESIGEMFGLEVAVRLPGGRDDARWRPAIGDRVTITADGEQWNVANIGALVVATLSGLALIWRVSRRVRRRPRRRGQRPGRPTT